MSVCLPDEDKGKADCFIDDIFSIVVDINDNVDRLKKAPITVLEAVTYKSKEKGYLLRDDMVASDKMIVEGSLSEKDMFRMGFGH